MYTYLCAFYLASLLAPHISFDCELLLMCIILLYHTCVLVIFHLTEYRSPFISLLYNFVISSSAIWQHLFLSAAFLCFLLSLQIILLWFFIFT
jgi:hypothetical protein